MSDCKNKKCGCQDTMLTSPAPCPTPAGCANPEPCSAVYDAQCVVYTGDPIICDNVTLVPINTNLAEALNDIVDYFCNNSGGSSMTSTITCGIQDYPATVIVNSGTSYNDAIVAVSNYYCQQINNILNNPPVSQFQYEIGEYVPSQGGVIAHRWLSTSAGGFPTAGTVQNYLVVDTTDLSTGAPWDNGASVDISNVESTWDGQSNTNNLIATGAGGGITAGTAAVLCEGSSNNGQVDWYLPAIDELNKVAQNRWEINQGLISAMGSELSINEYWSSSEASSNRARVFNLISYTIGEYPKIQPESVRAVRKFSM